MDAKSSMAGQGHCMLISRLRWKHLSAKTKKKEGSARAWPVTAPMPKSDYFTREKREMPNDGSWHSIFCLPSTMGMAIFL